MAYASSSNQLKELLEMSSKMQSKLKKLPSEKGGHSDKPGKLRLSMCGLPTRIMPYLLHFVSVYLLAALLCC